MKRDAARRLIIASTFLLLWADVASAQFSQSGNFGYVYVRRAALSDAVLTGATTGLLKGIGTWRYFDLDVGYKATGNAEILVGLGGLTSKSNFIAEGILGTVEIKNWNVSVLARVFLTRETDRPRAFFDIGPSINALESNLVITGLVPLSIEEQSSRFGFVAGLGFVVPSGRIGLVARARYSYVQKQAQIDASTIQFTVGVRFGRG